SKRTPNTDVAGLVIVWLNTHSIHPLPISFTPSGTKAHQPVVQAAALAPMPRALQMCSCPMKIYSLLFVLLVGVYDAAAQSASISGFVTDATSGETLILANVQLGGTTKGTATNNA